MLTLFLFCTLMQQNRHYLCRKKVMNTYYNMSAEQMDRIKERAGRFNEPWSKEERDAVVSQFQNGRSVEEIARLQGRTANAIRIKLVQAGEIAPYLSRRGKDWTDAEIERLGRFYSQGYPVEACAKMLGRLRNETAEKLVEIGLLTNAEVEQVEYMLNTTDRFNIFRAQADYQIVGWRNAIIRFGASFTYNSCLSTNASPDAHNMGFEFSNHFWQGFLNWHFDSLDDNYFPRHGVAFDLFGAAIRCYGSPSYEGRFDLKAAIPLGQRVTLIPQLYNRWMTSDYDRYSSNLIGGYMPERYTPWQMPFVGINNTYISSNTIDIARLDLSINLFGQHYLTFIGNYLAEWWLNSPAEKFRGYFGTGAAYAVNTIVGPIQLCAHWSTLSHKFGMHFSLGYYF